MPIEQLDRAVLRLSGPDVKPWLDKLVTNNLSTPLNFAALLTPQGKIIADFFISFDGDDILIDTAKKFEADLHKRLKMYRLRAPIEITVEAELSVYAMWDGHGDMGEADPRHAALGQRIIAGDYIETTGDYNAHRLALGVVDSAYDFESAQMFAADVNMDLMNGVDFKKGCFIGQEVVSRMKRMTTVKKRARGLLLSGAAEAGDKIMAGERVIGEVLSVHDTAAMGLIRLDRWHDAAVGPTVNGVDVKIMGGVDGSR